MSSQTHVDEVVLEHVLTIMVGVVMAAVSRQRSPLCLLIRSNYIQCYKVQANYSCRKFDASCQNSVNFSEYAISCNLTVIEMNWYIGWSNVVTGA